MTMSTQLTGSVVRGRMANDLATVMHDQDCGQSNQNNWHGN